MLAFLLDIVEVPESHTGATMAKAFQDMLVNIGLENKVHFAIRNVRTCTHWSTDFHARR